MPEYSSMVTITETDLYKFAYVLVTFYFPLPLYLNSLSNVRFCILSTFFSNFKVQRYRNSSVIFFYFKISQAFKMYIVLNSLAFKLTHCNWLINIYSTIYNCLHFISFLVYYSEIGFFIVGIFYLSH